MTTVITTINWNDNITDSRSVINNNFSSLDTNKVEKTITVNWKALSGNITLTQDDVWSWTTNKVYTTTEQTKLAWISDWANVWVVPNLVITWATKTKITYDSKGLVTAWADTTTADIADSTNKRYVTDANLIVIWNTSWTNTWDQTSVSWNAWTVTTINWKIWAWTNVSLWWTWTTADPYIINSTWWGWWHTIQDEWTPLAQRTNLNFVWAWVTVTDWWDWPNSTIVTIPIETASTIWALIWWSANAIPNDTDYVATALTSWWVLQKITWSDVKIFLKSYFDTYYQAISITYRCDSTVYTCDTTILTCDAQ